MRDAFEKVKTLLRQEHPQLLGCLLTLLCTLEAARFPGTIFIFLFHMLDMSSAILRPSHSFTRIVSCLARSEDKLTLIDCAFSCLKDLHQQHTEERRVSL